MEPRKPVKISRAAEWHSPCYKLGLAEEEAVLLLHRPTVMVEAKVLFCPTKSSQGSTEPRLARQGSINESGPMSFPTFSPSHFNVWPVVQRELREGARRPVNHRLRFGSAAVGTLLLWIISAHNSDVSAAQVGGWLFASLHTLLLGLIAVIVPALTADCIAREKREGTLGLLFMTPLSAGGIVAGKALAQGLRAFSLWLAVLPILAIPFMTGGITWFDALSALSLEFCATVLCLAAGLLASSLVKERSSAFMLAFLLSIFFLILFSQFFGVVLFVGWRGFAGLRQMEGWRECLEIMSILCGLLNVRGFPLWSAMSTFSTRLSQIWAWLCLGSPLIVLLFFYVAACFAARRIRRSWQDKIPSLRRESLLRRYCTPLFRHRFRRGMQRTLDWNPIAWLQQYSWKARLSKWGLCLAFLLIGCATQPLSEDDLGGAAAALVLTLAGIYTFVGVGGFLEEKRSGALELLLISPVPVNKLIFGRVWGLWKQFLPAALVLACFYAHLAGDFFFTLACGFLALPVFATYSALRVKNLIAASFLTWIALCVPVAFAWAFSGMFIDVDQTSPVIVAPLLFLSYGAFARLACFLLRHSLSRRIYLF
jgi:ABC-type transport system involved in multi-copper enzyme maturation permease subunit